MHTINLLPDLVARVARLMLTGAELPARHCKPGEWRNNGCHCSGEAHFHGECNCAQLRQERHSENFRRMVRTGWASPARGYTTVVGLDKNGQPFAEIRRVF